jgi:hypothetical protein
MPPSESNAPADPRELRVQVLHATDLLQLLRKGTTATRVEKASAREKTIERIVLCRRGKQSQTEQGQDDTHHSLCYAHLWSHEQPIRHTLILVHVVYLLATSPRVAQPHTQIKGQ